MADRYWVGGSGTWDASTTTNWATTSGGAGGASAPTSADNAYFDGNSDAGAPFTVTLGTGAVCADVIIGDGSTVTVLDQTMTLAGAGSVTWSIYGSLYFPVSNFSLTYQGQYFFRATSTGKTITTNGAAIQAANQNYYQFTFDGVGGGWSLGSALTINASGTYIQGIEVIKGSFSTNNYNVTCRSIASSNTNVRSIDFGSSTVTTAYQGSGAFINFDISTNLTFNAGTSTVVLDNAANSGIIRGGGVTFYKIRISNPNTTLPNFLGVSFVTDLIIDRRSSAGVSSLSIFSSSFPQLTVTGTLLVQSGFGATFDITDTAGAITAATVNAGGEGYNVGDVLNVTGGNGDAQLTVATLSGTAIATVTISTPGTGYTTATGVATTLATSALNPNRRVLIASDTLGTARTITAAAVNITNADFRDITGAGAATWSDSGRTRYWGNALGNSGITFSAGVSKYRIGTGNWSATQWAATSGGAAAVGNFPLAQDTCVFDANTTTGTHSLDASYFIGSLDMSALTSAATMAINVDAIFFGNVTLGANATVSGTGRKFFSARSPTIQTITSAGKTIPGVIHKNASGTLELNGDLTVSLVGSDSFILNAGTLKLNNNVLTVGRLSDDTVTTTREINFGTSGQIVLTAAGLSVWSIQNLSGLTISGTSNVIANNSGTGNKNFFHGNLGGGTEARAISVRVTAGSGGTITFGGDGRWNNINIDSGVTQAVSFQANGYLYGDLSIASTVSSLATAGLFFFEKTSGTQAVTLNGKSLTASKQKNGAGTLQLLDAFNGSASSFTLNAGTIDLNGQTLTLDSFSSSNSTTRSIAFGSGGVLRLSGSGTAFNATTGTNLTTTGTGVIDLTSASTKTFAGGGRTYPTLNQGGTGTLLITGANTFADITNTVQPTTITFPSGVTTSVQDFSVGGTLGNLVTLNASTPGTRAILNRV